MKCIRFAARLAFTPIVVLEQVGRKSNRATPPALAKRVLLLLILAAAIASFAPVSAAAASDRVAITISSEKPLGPAPGTFSTSGAFSDSGVLVTESRIVSAIPAPFGVVSHFVLRFEGAFGTFTIRAQIIETVIDDDVEGVWINEGSWVIVGGTGAYSTLLGNGAMEGTVDHNANLITRIYTGLVQFE